MQLTKEDCLYKLLSVFVCPQFCVPVCLSVQCQIENTSVSTNTHTHTLAHAYQSENQWRRSQITMGHTWLCFFFFSPLALLSSSHPGGIWNLLAVESHQAIKPSQAHKCMRARTSNNVGPARCQQTQRILNLNKLHRSFFTLSVCLSKLFLLFFPPPANHLGMN